MGPPLNGERSSRDEEPRRNDVVDRAADAPAASADKAGGTREPETGIRHAHVGAEPEKPDGDLERRIRRLSRRGFTLAGVTAVAGLAGWRWLNTRDQLGGLPWPLRRALEFDERLARAIFSKTRLAPQFSRSRALLPRVNGTIGLEPGLDLSAWKLRVVGPAGPQSQQSFTLDEIKALPRVEMTTELRCIEGWSDVVHWAGARLSDLAAVTGSATRSGEPADPIGNAGDLLGYAALETPDREYYVGLDMASALHPQTLLCYEMDGRPLTPEHGAPLRLAIPVKYGIKNLKRIGTIRFTDVRPTDYWAEAGYDWYAGH